MKRALALTLAVFLALSFTLFGQVQRVMDSTDLVDTFMFKDDTWAYFGTGQDASFAWVTDDANANYFGLELPTGGAVNVPVFGIGVGLDGVDLGDFNGFTQPTFFIADLDRDSEIYISYSADDVGLLTGVGTIASFGITFATITNTASTLLVNYTPDFRVGYDASTYLKVVVTQTTGNVAITQAGSTKSYTHTAAGGFSFIGPFAVTGALTNNGNAVVLNHRHRVTVAEINAGHELLPAIAGRTYRMISCVAIAYGGAVGAVTTVDILGTESAAGVKLVAYAQANLTQSAVLTSGGTGAAVLADAASYIPCDANSAITIGKTGSDATTATGVDIILTYVIE